MGLVWHNLRLVWHILLYIWRRFIIMRINTACTAYVQTPTCDNIVIILCSRYVGWFADYPHTMLVPCQSALTFEDPLTFVETSMGVKMCIKDVGFVLQGATFHPITCICLITQGCSIRCVPAKCCMLPIKKCVSCQISNPSDLSFP